MKTAATLAAAMLMTLAASAQYAPTKQGMTLTYTNTNTEANKTLESVDVVEAIECTDGTTTVHIKSTLKSGDINGDLEMNSKSVYTTPDAPTKVIMMTGDEFKEFILKTIKMGLEEAGQFNPSQFDEITKAFKAKGELSLELNPAGATGDKIPTSKLRLDMGMQGATMFLSKGLIAGYESISTEAGTFDKCIKVTYEESQNSPQGAEKAYVTAWYAPEVGLVKEIKADKKGKVLEEQTLKSITQ